jgi:opacity protein-like surface antigen
MMLCSVFTFSQEIKFGAKVGLNISRLRGNYPTAGDPNGDEIAFDNKSKIGFHLGGFAEYKINKKFSLQPEFLISTQGGVFEVKFTEEGEPYPTFTQTSKLTYLSLPIMLKYKVLEKLSVEFGPQIGYLISAKSKWKFVDPSDPSENGTIQVDLLHDGTYTFNGSTVQVKPRVNRFDFGLNLGASYDLTEKIFIQGRYNFGISTVDKNSTNGVSTDSWNTKNSVIQISTGYKF